MRIEETVVNIIFDAGKGYTSVASREGVCGSPYGELPKPSRAGYAFEGWYHNGEAITADTILESEADVRLVAKWVKKAAEAKKPSVMRNQRIVAMILAISIVFLGVAIVIANNLVSIYYIRDEYFDANGVKQTERYTLKRQNGLYRMFNRDGVEMEVVEEHSYQSQTDGAYYKVYVADVSGNQYMINTSTGAFELFAVVDYDESLGETLDGTVTNKRIMIFPRIAQDNVFSITVKNQYGSYEIYRRNLQNTDSSTGKKYTTAVQIRGTEGTLTSYDPTLFASLCVSCGYTLSIQKLYFDDPETPRDENGNVRYEDYGLEKEYNEKGELVYEPAVYTIVAGEYSADGQCNPAKVNGETVQYTVKVGRAILSGGGYYVQLEGRDTVYIVAPDIAETVLQPVESLVKPMITYPMSSTTYVMPYNFRLGQISGSVSDLSNAENNGKLDLKDVEIKLFTSFSYKSEIERAESIESADPYILNTSDLQLMSGYRVSSTSISEVLKSIYTMQFLGCKKLHPNEDDMKLYGLDKDVYFLMFDYDPQIANGGSPESEWAKNAIWISQRTEQGTYYVYATLYDMIVEVDQAYFSFLDWGESRWYEKLFFQPNIGYMKNMSITVGGKTYDFIFDNRFSYAYYDNGDGTGSILDLSKGKLTQTADGYIYTANEKSRRAYLMDFTAGRTYLDEKTNKIMYRGVGDKGEILVPVTFGSRNLQLTCPQYQGKNGSLLDYPISVLEDSGYTGVSKEKTYTAVDNFRRLYLHMLFLSIMGDAEGIDDFDAYVKENTPVASISYSLEDMASILNPKYFEKNNKQEVTIRFYEHPVDEGHEGQYLITIETPDTNGQQGRFYVSADSVNDIGTMLEMLLNEELVPNANI